MDALILSCGTGGGHNSAGRAIEQELASRGHNVTFLDPFTLKGHRTSAAINNAYISLAQRAPGAFGAVYALGNAYRKLPFRSPVYHANRAMAPLLKKYLDEHPCDAIVTSHLFPAEMATHMKLRGMKVPATYFIATDYTCVPFTEETDCDMYITPSPELTDEYLSRGVPAERILPLGIPVRREFSESADRAQARARLGFEDDRLHILVAGGSIGAGSLHVTVETLISRFPGARIIVICGGNRALYDRLRRDFGVKCAPLGYTSHISDYMRACDIFISKPGGLSSTEAAVIGTALVHVTPIPGCETRNMEFFANRGMCLPVNDPKKELSDACDTLLDGSAQARMRECQKRGIPQNAASNICDLLEARHSAGNNR